MSESELKPSLKISPVEVFKSKNCLKCNDYRMNNGLCAACSADITACCRIMDYIEFWG